MVEKEAMMMMPLIEVLEENSNKEGKVASEEVATTIEPEIMMNLPSLIEDQGEDNKESTIRDIMTKSPEIVEVILIKGRE